MVSGHTLGGVVGEVTSKLLSLQASGPEEAAWHSAVQTAQVQLVVGALVRP